MKLEISEERANPLLKRTELVVAIEHGSEATPSKAALQQLLAKHLKKDVAHIDIRNIFSLGGTAQSHAKVFVWQEKMAKDLSKPAEKKEAMKQEGGQPPAPATNA
ncbi:MAG: hypothetical protein HYY37_04490 [Candidatus Aenigmarchaeota archaeon]|nr:hypothetical protein [Candidatus Aenigmarchaeota archaeon]